MALKRVADCRSYRRCTKDCSNQEHSDCNPNGLQGAICRPDANAIRRLPGETIAIQIARAELRNSIPNPKSIRVASPLSKERFPPLRQSPIF
jgi:hypothetical protein